MTASHHCFFVALYWTQQEERQALLHEGSGSAAVNAFVEVVFDNSDNRFSLENSDEVVLRRTVGSKKDEFFLQRKRATKQEVQSLLEGAGFSKSNPYFMVQQGKIQSICLMSDEQRLGLLQQVAGTTLYEDKKAESLVKMQENAQSIGKIDSILNDIDGRLNELHGEKEELTIYQNCDRTRKALEYTLYDKELRKARMVLDNLEHERALHLEEQSSLHDTAKELHDQIHDAEAALKVQLQALKRNKNQLLHTEQDKMKAVTIKTQLDLQCQELQDLCVQGQEALQGAEQELTKLRVQIKRAKSDLAEKDIALSKEDATLQILTEDRDQAVRQADALYAKQGRGQQYSSKEERDKHLRSQIAETGANKREREQQLSQMQDSLAKLRRQKTEQEQDLSRHQSDLRSKKDSLESMRKTLEEAKQTRLELMDVRKKSWRKENELNETSTECRKTFKEADEAVYRTMPRATAMGVKALKNIVERERLIPGQQYFGMVIDNFALKEEKYRTVVDTAAQNSLFHVIVDTDATAALLMERLEKQKLGRVTFIPLNRMRDFNTQYPVSLDVQPILQECIQFEKRVEAAMKHVFDKKLVAQTSEIASEWSARLHMDCITLEGDFCSRRGALSGGFVNQEKSRLRVFAKAKMAEQEFKKSDSEWRQAYEAANQADQDVTGASDHLAQLEHKQKQLTSMVNSMEKQTAQKENQISSSVKQADRIEKKGLPTLEREIDALSADMARLEEEVGTDLTVTLSDEERARLSELKDTAKSLEAKINDQSETVDEMHMEREKVHSLLEENLLKRETELTQVYSEDGGVATTAKLRQDQRTRDLEERRQQLKQAVKDLGEIEASIEKERKAAEDIKADLLAAKNNLEKLKEKDMKTSKLLEESQAKADKFMSKVGCHSIWNKYAPWIGIKSLSSSPFALAVQKSMNLQKRENYVKKIQDLGSLPPPGELDQHKNKSIQDLEKSLDKVNKKLKKYSHVNKKAFDQYLNFSEQRESLIKRKEELDSGEEKVKELVESLDRQKDEAINRTFRGVSKHFAEVFKELVPLGEGSLKMRTKLDDRADNEESTDDDMDESDPESPVKRRKTHDPENPDVDSYLGVQINVRFSMVGENFMMSQLSGGQKALVALALIFAIQRCDPAPFYIFDELDQALDSSYRQAVANVIKNQANNPETPTQFITSTFRPELVAIAKNCYGISHQNKVSSLYYTSKSVALKFIKELMNEEEAVGEVSRSRTPRRRRTIEAAGELEETDTVQAALPAANEDDTTAADESAVS